MAPFKYQRLPTDSPGQEPRKSYTAFTHRITLTYCNIKAKVRASVSRKFSIRKQHRNTRKSLFQTSENADTAVEDIQAEHTLERKGSFRVVFKDMVSFLSRSGTLRDNANEEGPEPLVLRTQFRMIPVKKSAKNAPKMEGDSLKGCKSPRNSFLTNTKSLVRSLGPRALRPFPSDEVKVEKEVLELEECERVDTERELSGERVSISQLLPRVSSEVSVSVSPSCIANYTDMANLEPVIANNVNENDDLPSLVDASAEEESLYTLENVPAMVTDFLMPQEICVPKSAGFSIMFEEMENAIEMEKPEKIVNDEFDELMGFVAETLAAEEKKEEKPSVPFTPLCKPVIYPSAAVMPVIPVYDFSSLLHPSMRCGFEQGRPEARGPSFVYMNSAEEFAPKGKIIELLAPHNHSEAKDEDTMEKNNSAIAVVPKSTKPRRSAAILAPVAIRPIRLLQGFLSPEVSPIEATSALILPQLLRPIPAKAEEVEPKKKRKHKSRAKKGRKGRNKLRVGQKRV